MSNNNKRNKIAALLLMFPVFAGCSSPEPGPKVPKVLVVGWDGARADATLAADTPVFDLLAAQGAYSYSASTQTKAPTVSSPGWLSLLTGVEPDKHLVVSNDNFAEHDKKFPSFLARARNEFGLETAAACDWETLCLLMLDVEEALDHMKFGDELEVTDQMVDWLGNEDFSVHFVHLDLPDHAGHDTGYSPDNPDYIQAIEESDRLTGRLVDAIENRETRKNELWLIAVVTDHGGEGTGHGPINDVNQRIPFVISGDTVDSGEFVQRVFHMDLHPTVISHLGIPIDPTWGLDGQVVGLQPEE